MTKEDVADIKITCEGMNGIGSRSQLILRMLTDREALVEALRPFAHPSSNLPMAYKAHLLLQKMGELE